MNDASRNVPRSVAWVALAALTLILAGCGVRYDFVIHDNETADSAAGQDQCEGGQCHPGH